MNCNTTHYRANSSSVPGDPTLLLQQEPIKVGVLAGIADYQGAIERAVETACRILADARADLLVLPASESQTALEQVTHYLEARLRKCLK